MREKSYDHRSERKVSGRVRFSIALFYHKAMDFAAVRGLPVAADPAITRRGGTAPFTVLGLGRSGRLVS